MLFREILSQKDKAKAKAKAKAKKKKKNQRSHKGTSIHNDIREQHFTTIATITSLITIERQSQWHIAIL